jgi:hypothetical protein
VPGRYDSRNRDEDIQKSSGRTKHILVPLNFETEELAEKSLRISEKYTSKSSKVLESREDQGT